MILRLGRHGGHLFGDMTNTLVVSHADGCDLMCGEGDAVVAI